MLLCGGNNIRADINQIKAGAQIIIGTAGRTLDFIRKKLLPTDHLKMLVLDEADEMLDRGFKDSIKELFLEIPPEVQVGLFSATMPKEILSITDGFMRDPVKILLKNEDVTLHGIKQYFVSLENESWKFDTLISLYSNLDVVQMIIYVNTKARCEELSK